jgi:hypothetical protein
VNNIVTRGFGQGHRIVTRGYGSILDQILDTAKDTVRKIGGSAKIAVEDLKEKIVIVRAALVEVNSQKIENVQGHVKNNMRSLDIKVSAKVLISRVYKQLKEIFIRATNIKSSRHRRK